MTQFDFEEAMPGNQNLQRHAAAPSASLEQMGSRVWLNNLIYAVGFHRLADPAAEDTSNLLRIISDVSSGSQNRAVAVMMSPVLQEWMRSTVSRQLIVNGHAYPVEEEVRESALSFFCAKLVDSIISQASLQPAGSRGIFAVRWFCGQHTYSSTDSDPHPSGMLSNMVGQLALQLFARPLVPQLGHRPYPRGNAPLSTLCSLFTVLVESLPRDSILFIVIDGILYYKNDDRRKECIEALSTITYLARVRPAVTNDGPRIKLLVMNPLKSHHVQSLFAESETLDLDEHIKRSDGYTESLWNTRMSGMIRSALR